MATITIDPVNRIEGHLKAVVTVNESSGVVSDAMLSGTMFRGFEMILNKRDPRDAPVITQRICGVCPTSHAISSNMCLDTAFGITNDPGTGNSAGNIALYSTSIPDNGRMIRNIIHGMDTVMSHITHLYHLSALDFINTSSYPGMAPWMPSYTASDMLVATGANTDTTANTLVLHYVQALGIRRKCHTAGALFSGRQPIQSAMVPGGVTTLFSTTYPMAEGTTSPNDPAGFYSGGPYNATTTQAKFAELVDEVRDFIDQAYIPDVVTVATHGDFLQFWSAGIGCKRFLSYGAFPDSAGTLALKRGIVDANVDTVSASGTLPSPLFDQARVLEYVDGSYYNYGVLDAEGLHPFDGKTVPNMNDTAHTGKTGGYSWLKAPRYNRTGSTTVPVSQVYEVGPLARMVVSYVANDTVTQVVSKNAVSIGSTLLVGALGSYSVPGLVGNAVTGLIGAGAGSDATLLFSVLGRHAARALEAKFVADACAAWADALTVDAPCYKYAKIPKQVSAGYGLIEVPRGSLGHWIKIEGRKIAKYQCVVPTTWNASPASGGTAKDNHGPAEQALIDSTVGTNPTAQIINILRILHPFDFCIACAVHVVTPEGKEKLKFAIGADGRPTNVEIAE
jgi:hydrogenase large subunit